MPPRLLRIRARAARSCVSQLSKARPPHDRPARITPAAAAQAAAGARCVAPARSPLANARLRDARPDRRCAGDRLRTDAQLRDADGESDEPELRAGPGLGD